MALLGSIRRGSWWINSKSDPRWNMSGEGYVGGCCIPPDAQNAIYKLKKKLGEEPPEDLEYGYMKD